MTSTDYQPGEAGIGDTAARKSAVTLASQGWSYRRIGAELGCDESVIRRTPEVRAARIKADPNAHSVTTRSATVACRVQPATELISRIEWTLASLLGADYRLSLNDARRLANILQAGLEGLAK